MPGRLWGGAIPSGDADAALHNRCQRLGSEGDTSAQLVTCRGWTSRRPRLGVRDDALVRCAHGRAQQHHEGRRWPRQTLPDLRHPLYTYARRRGYSPEDAEGFDAGFLRRPSERKAVATVSPDKGRFRSFLLASLNHFLSESLMDKARALKRGGGKGGFLRHGSRRDMAGPGSVRKPNARESL